MAFLGGLSGIGSLAGGLAGGLGEGLNVNQYLSNLQAQKLAGNVLQAYGGQGAQGAQPVGGLSNLFGGGQGGGGSQPMPQTGGGMGGQQANPLSGLMNLFQQGGAGAGAQPVSSQAPVPGAPTGQPGVGAGLGLPQQAQSQPQPSPQMTPPQGQQQPPQPQPFDASGRMAGGMQQQMTLPQFVQMVRQVAPNANGRQVMMAAQELGKGGLLGFGGITPYQSAELGLRREGANVASERLALESQKLAQGWDEFKTREQRIENNSKFAQKKVQSALAFRDSQMKVLELQKQRDEAARTIQFSTMDDNDKKKAMDELDKKYEGPITAAQKIADDALKASNESAPSEDGGGGQPDYANSPDGKMMHYKGTGDRSDASNWEAVQ